MEQEGLSVRRGRPRAARPRARSFVIVSSLACTAAFSACGGGGGGSTALDDRVVLIDVAFPDPAGINAEPEDVPPRDAPLAQQIVFTFDGNPDPNGVSSLSLPVRDPAGALVNGTYDVDGPRVTFTPALPKRPIVVFAPGIYDLGGAGVQPDSSYTVRLGPLDSTLVARATSELRARFPDEIDLQGILLGFHTTADPARFTAGLAPATPQLVSVDPRDGTTGVSPELWSDPDHLFPPRRSYTLVFDRSLAPDPANVGALTLLDLDDRPSGSPNGLSLGLETVLLENRPLRSVLQITPSGILPFGHLLALEYATDLKSFSESGSPSGPRAIATTFTVADGPTTTIHDRLQEDFVDEAREDPDVEELQVGTLPAEWDRLDSDLLQAALAFQGDGVLGSFVPPPPPTGQTRTIFLDTTRQVFPLPDGSTPDAPPGFEVIGGVFDFTDIDIPEHVTIRPVGDRPLVITATGSVKIAGDIVLSGDRGTSDFANDSGITYIPGGSAVAGGGHGGEGHPILFFPPDQYSYHYLVSAPAGGSGFGVDPSDGVVKRIGGLGGQSGIMDFPDPKGNYSTENEIACVGETNHGREKTPGGGGGSMLRAGLPPLNPKKKTEILDGKGNVNADGLGGYLVHDDTVLKAGLGGLPVFRGDDDTDDFFGSRGQLRRLLGGQGGGAGATRLEGYYCGWWCDHDTDPSNDAVCSNDDILWAKYGSSVGDARGGGGGGGGGCFMLQVLGSMTIASTASILSAGGNGGGGEPTGTAELGGGGGGGGGGVVILQSATSLTVESGAVIDVSGGAGKIAIDPQWIFGGARGSGGDGGDGLVQLQVPAGERANVVNASSIVPVSSWVDTTNTLNPAEFTPTSVGLSRWYDMGRMIRRPPANTNPLFAFRGLDPNGYVATDSAGNVIDPASNDFTCGYLGQKDPVTKKYILGEEPRADWVPPSATVRIEFQGGNAVVEGSKEVDPATLTPWSGTPTIADGMQFLRWRITFDITADGSDLTAHSRRPVVLQLGVDAEF
jgi:hypothetical protein